MVSAAVCSLMLSKDDDCWNASEWNRWRLFGRTTGLGPRVVVAPPPVVQQRHTVCCPVCVRPAARAHRATDRMLPQATRPELSTNWQLLTCPAPSRSLLPPSQRTASTPPPTWRA